MNTSYQDLYADALYALLSIHRKNLGILEQQAALFTFLHVPPHILQSIDLEKTAINAIKAELLARGQDPQKDLITVREVDKRSHTYQIEATDSATLPPGQDETVRTQLDLLSANAQQLSSLEQAKAWLTWSLTGLLVLFVAYFFAMLVLPQRVLTSPVLNLAVIIAGIGVLGLLIYSGLRFFTSGGRP